MVRTMDSQRSTSRFLELVVNNQAGVVKLADWPRRPSESRGKVDTVLALTTDRVR